jgi:hypothetical protein
VHLLGLLTNKHDPSSFSADMQTEHGTSVVGCMWGNPQWGGGLTVWMSGVIGAGVQAAIGWV